MCALSKIIKFKIFKITKPKSIQSTAGVGSCSWSRAGRASTHMCYRFQQNIIIQLKLIGSLIEGLGLGLGLDPPLPPSGIEDYIYQQTKQPMNQQIQWALVLCLNSERKRLQMYFIPCARQGGVPAILFLLFST